MELEIKLYCVDYCLGYKWSFIGQLKIFVMQNILLYLDLPCRLTNNLYAPKGFGKMFPVYVEKHLAKCSLYIVNMCKCWFVSTILIHGSPGTMKPRLPHQSLNILLCQHMPRLDLLHTYKSDFLLYTYCWTSPVRNWTCSHAPDSFFLLSSQP